MNGHIISDSGTHNTDAQTKITGRTDLYGVLRKEVPMLRKLFITNRFAIAANCKKPC